MSSLRRTRIGMFHVENARNIEDFEQEIRQLAISSEGQSNA